MRLRNYMTCAGIIVLSAVATKGCLMGSEDSCGDCSPAAPIWLRPDLSNLEGSVVVAGRRYSMEAFAWRDFMPGNPCSKLAVAVRLHELDSLDVPEGTSPEFVWVRHGGDWWSGKFGNALRFHVPPSFVESHAGCGPTWPTGDLVDVVIQVRFSNSTEAFLRQNDVLIERTE